MRCFGSGLANADCGNTTEDGSVKCGRDWERGESHGTGTMLITVTNPNWANLTWSPRIALDADLPTYQTHITRAPGLNRVRSPQLVAQIGEM
jgi:hypothetical protein